MNRTVNMLDYALVLQSLAAENRDLRTANLQLQKEVAMRMHDSNRVMMMMCCCGTTCFSAITNVMSITGCHLLYTSYHHHHYYHLSACIGKVSGITTLLTTD